MHVIKITFQPKSNNGSIVLFQVSRFQSKSKQLINRTFPGEQSAPPAPPASSCLTSILSGDSQPQSFLFGDDDDDDDADDDDGDDNGGDDDDAYDNDSLRSLLASLWTRVCGETGKLSRHLEPLLELEAPARNWSPC